MKKPLQKRIKTEKLYVYVDETGQDTKGEIFIVSVVVAKKDHLELQKYLEEIEMETGKKATKWNKAKVDYRIIYLEKVFSNNKLKNAVFYSLARETKMYRDTTIVTIASATNEVRSRDKYKASIFIDGLQKAEVLLVGKGLRRVGLCIEKVRGVRDESNSIIRLADSIAGLVRKNEEGVEYARKLFKSGLKKGIIRRI